LPELLGVRGKMRNAWGNTGKKTCPDLPSGGSQTTPAIERAEHAVAMDARKKLQESRPGILAASLIDYESERTRLPEGWRAGMSLAKDAQRAVQLGGVLLATTCPKDIK